MNMTVRRINYIGATSIYNHSLINHTKIALPIAGLFSPVPFEIVPSERGTIAIVPWLLLLDGSSLHYVHYINGRRWAPGLAEASM
jgi:hypothetical protein